MPFGARSDRTAADPPHAGGRSAPERLKVFISYSRADMAFADEIVAGLEFDGSFDVTIDRHDIHEGEEWQKRLGALIAAADTVVFILSQKSAASPICRWEVDHAKALSKRIIPVQAEALGGIAAPEALAKLNYVRFDEGRSFMAGLTGLRRALKTDIDWLREHTRLMGRAQEWVVAGRPENRLLSGGDITAAKGWLERAPPEGLQPTDLHRDFIRASDEAETLRLSEERDRSERLERAVRRTKSALIVALLLAGTAGIATLLAVSKERTVRSLLQEQKGLLEKERELSRVEKFLTLLSANPAGTGGMNKICLEAIESTSTLATTVEPPKFEQSRDRFWELYYSSMYIVELHERSMSADRTSKVETGMVKYGYKLSALELGGDPLPYTPLCEFAKSVRDACVEHLQITAPEPCQQPGPKLP